MNNSITKNEKKFFDALNDIFIGVKVEGKGGYINLMNIKSKYYKEHIYGAIYRFIEERFNSNNSNREELFARLYTFFNRYFNETGSIYFQYTPLKENIYERVYSNKEDVSLFYKTHMLYYVKSEKIFKSIDLKVEDEDKYQDFHFNFDVSQLELAKNNEKKEIIFEFVKVENKKIFLNVLYSTGGKKTKIDEILKNIKKHDKNIKIEENLLNTAIKTYKKQAEVDFFINKDAKKFLKEQFNLWYYGYIFGDGNNGEFNISDFDDRRIRELQWTKEIAYKIIDFISQFEDELVKVWNKPKFVRKSNYVLTLDKLENNIDLVNKIISHKGFIEQEKEWKELGYNLENYSKDKIISGNSLNQDFKYLTIDTAYFEDIKYEILDNFDNLDDELNGVLIKSDNYQALNTLQNKYRGKVKCIYIDPPYNTGSDGFIYKDGIKHGTWLTMMENRLKLAHDFLTDDGVIFVSIDDKEQANLKLLMDEVFGSENFIANIIWRKSSGKNDSKFLAVLTEYVLIYRKSEKLDYFNRRSLDINFKNKDEKGNFNIEKLDRGGLEYRKNSDYIVKSPDGDEIFPGSDKKAFLERKNGNYKDRDWQWRLSEKRFYDELNKGNIYFKKIKNNWSVYTKRYEGEDSKTPFSNIIDFINNSDANKELINMYGDKNFSFPKPTKLIKQIISIGSSDNDIILDFFSGSGTTQHSVIELNKKDGGNRKYIGVEMGEHFDNVIKPRIKKVINSKEWKNGIAKDKDGISHIMKYQSLEQYEEALEKLSYSEDTIFIEEENKDIFSNYVFLKDEKLTKAIELDLENGKTKIDLTKIYDDIDIPETLSNITGKNIKKIKKDSVILEEIGEIKYDNIPLELVKPLIWWK